MITIEEIDKVISTTGQKIQFFINFISKLEGYENYAQKIKRVKDAKSLLKKIKNEILQKNEVQLKFEEASLDSKVTIEIESKINSSSKNESENLASKSFELESQSKDSILIKPTENKASNDNNESDLFVNFNQEKMAEVTFGHPDDAIIDSLESSLDTHKTIRYILPVTDDEIVQFWQRGYVCHPNILESLCKNTDRHKSSDLSSQEKIDLSKSYSVNCNTLIEFKQNLNISVIDSDWMTSIHSIKNIIVSSEDIKIGLIRLLKACKRSFSDEVKIEVDRFSFNHMNTEKITGLKQTLNPDKFFEFDSLLGGIAVSSFTEKKLMIRGDYPKEKLSFYGSFFSNIFDSSASDSSLLNQVCVFIKKRNNSFLNGCLTILKTYDETSYEDLKEHIFKYHRREDSRITGFDLNEINLFLKEGKSKSSIQLLSELKNSERPFVDPFLMFLCLISNYKSITNVASRDKQSLAFAISEYYEEGIIDFNQYIIQNFLLGYTLGYGMLWNPERVDNEWSKKGSYPFQNQTFLNEDLHLFFDKVAIHCDLSFYLEPTSDKLNREYFSNIHPKERKIMFNNNDFSILIQDDLISKYKSLNKEHTKELFNELLDEFVNSKSINVLSARVRNFINFFSRNT